MRWLEDVETNWWWQRANNKEKSASVIEADQVIWGHTEGVSVHNSILLSENGDTANIHKAKYNETTI